jgi:hypothetical protein
MNLKMFQYQFHASAKTGLKRQTRIFRAPWFALLGALILAALLAGRFSAAAQTTNSSDFSFFQIVSQRNIFNQNRTAYEHSARPAPRVVDSFALVGTMSYAKGTFAFFDGSSAEFRKALAVNGEIANFKIAAITPNSVTLSDGTNQTILKVTMQMRRDENGHWVVSTEPASYSSAGNSSAPESRRRFSRHRSAYTYSAPQASSQPASASANGDEQMDMPVDDSNMVIFDGGDSEMDTNAPDNGDANNPLERLMQMRQQEEQQLGR